MKILLLESFYTSSHKQWADGLIKKSSHDIHLISLPGRHWKWKMHHAGKYFAYEIANLKSSFDLILCSDLMNVGEFRGVMIALGSSRSWFNNIPIVSYFHENQITYPWSENDPDISLKRDNHYGWINYISCVSSDHILFNSHFHKSNFNNSLPDFLSQFPKVSQDDCVKSIEEKSKVIPIGLTLKDLAINERLKNNKPTILWNHRWEYDKNPELFFNTLIDLKEKGLDFEIIIAGESYKNYPKIFDQAKEQLSDRIIHFGFAKDREHYEKLLSQSDILPVTSNQDFFGISVIEAIAAGCTPLLPNRLAFPEHLPEAKHKKYYFNTSIEFTEKLSHLINSESSSSPSLREYILKYDWDTIAPMYDNFFNKIKPLNPI